MFYRNTEASAAITDAVNALATFDDPRALRQAALDHGASIVMFALQAAVDNGLVSTAQLSLLSDALDS